jgi:hypothetical protein
MLIPPVYYALLMALLQYCLAVPFDYNDLSIFVSSRFNGRTTAAEASGEHHRHTQKYGKKQT